MLRLLDLLGPYVMWVYPIGVLILLIYLRAWLVASRDLRASLFSLERETAVARMRRAAAGAFAAFGILVLIFVCQFYLVPSLNVSGWIQPTPTPEFITRTSFVATPTPTATASPEATPAPTNTRRPTPLPVTPAPSPMPTEAVSLPPADCPSPGIQITQPGQGMRLKGRVEIRGTAQINNFQFYKIEIGVGERPARWTSISEVRKSPVTNGLLEVWDTSGLAEGVYSLRLVVVDTSGNFPPPCELQVVVIR